jgi:hypothetical protein
MTTRPFICVCTHPRSWHRTDMFGTQVCLLCAVCGLEEFEHRRPFGHGHPFTECNCGGTA